MDNKTLLLSTALLALATPALAQNYDPALDAMSAAELLPLAQAEGTVTVYAFTSRIAAVEAAFEAAYPGIDMVSHDMSSTEQITRIKAEASAGIASVDVVYISDAPVVFTELLGPGLVTQYVPPRVVPLLDNSEKNPLLAQRLSTKVLMYNEEANPDGSPVSNLWELTTPRLDRPRHHGRSAAARRLSRPDDRDRAAVRRDGNGLPGPVRPADYPR